MINTINIVHNAVLKLYRRKTHDSKEITLHTVEGNNFIRTLLITKKVELEMIYHLKNSELV